VEAYREQRAIGISTHLVEMVDGRLATHWKKIPLADLPNAEIPEDQLERFGLCWVYGQCGGCTVEIDGFRPYLDEPGVAA
jgi:hypothetical protein